MSILSIVKQRIKLFVKAVKRKKYFSEKIKMLALQPDLLSEPATVRMLIDCWDNSWSVQDECLSGLIGGITGSEKMVLECGSGLTTLVLSVFLRGRNSKIISLEHDWQWFREMQSLVNKCELKNVEIIYAPLKKYEGYEWYSMKTPHNQLCFDVVVCDGPPAATTKGERYGLLPVMKDRLKKGSLIFLDDLNRSGEKEVLARWQSEFDIRNLSISGSVKPYASFNFHQHQ